MVPGHRYALLLQPLLKPAAGYARSILRNRQDAQDAVQQAALRGLERVGTYDDTRPFKPWWFAILRNCCIDALRDRRSSVLDRPDYHDPPQPESADPEDWEELALAIDRLSQDHREVLRLRSFGDLNYAELAEALRIPPGTVMSRLHVARKALRATMTEGHS